MHEQLGSGLVTKVATFLLGALGGITGVTACFVEPVTFSKDPQLTENCAVAGDEDGNGLADCDDQLCANLVTCQPHCSNGKVERGEMCDDGQATSRCDADCTLPACNDGQLNRAAGEEADPPLSNSMVVHVNTETCRYDFSTVSQLFCAGTCGAWGGGNGCQQADADAFCKLKTGNATAVAIDYTIGTATAAPGICCPTVPPSTTGCTGLGTFANRGVLQDVSVHETNLLSTHGAGNVISSVVCEVP